MRKAVLQCASFVIVAALSGCVHNDNVTKPQPDRASDINLELGIDYLRKGNLTQAKEKIERAVDQNPRNANAQATAGLLYDRLGETKKADQHFDRAVSLDPKNPDIASNYAAFLCRNGRHERGEKYALDAATNPLSKTPEVAYLNAGNCAMGQREFVRAEQHYRKAIAARPRFAPALFQLAEVSYAQKQHLSARAFLERYVEVARTTPSSLWLGVRIERALGNTGTANAYAQRLKNDYPSSAETRQLIESERNPG